MSFIKNIFNNIKYTKIIKKAYAEENMIDNLSKLFNVEFRIDWFGRLYTVLNPNLFANADESNSQIFEYGENGLSNRPYVEQWIMTRMLAVEKFIKTNGLFDVLTYRLKKLDKYDNYLLVIEPITFQPMVDSCKKAAKGFASFLGISIICTIILMLVVTNM